VIKIERFINQFTFCKNWITMTKEILEQLLADSKIPDNVITNEHNHIRVLRAKIDGYGPRGDQVEPDSYIDFTFNEDGVLEKYVITHEGKEERTDLGYDFEGRVSTITTKSGGADGRSDTAHYEYHNNNLVKSIVSERNGIKNIESHLDEQGRIMFHDEPLCTSITYYPAEGDPIVLTFYKSGVSGVELSDSAPGSMTPISTADTVVKECYEMYMGWLTRG
jgi:hypothetical protein